MNTIARNSIIIIIMFAAYFGYAQQEPQVQPDKKEIIIYGSETCHYCLDTKAFLEEHHISFVFYDIDTDRQALNNMLYKLRESGIDVSNLSIPVVDKGGEIFTNGEDFDAFLERIIK